MKAIIHVGLKPGVLDPQGRAIARSLGDLGFNEEFFCKGVSDLHRWAFFITIIIKFG